MSTLPILKFPRGPLFIAIDFDIYMQDLTLWREFCMSGLKLGHEIYVYTHKPLSDPWINLAGFPDGINIVCLGYPIITDYFLDKRIYIDTWIINQHLD